MQNSFFSLLFLPFVWRNKNKFLILQTYYQLVHASGWRVWADEFRTFGASQPQDILKRTFT